MLKGQPIFITRRSIFSFRVTLWCIYFFCFVCFIKRGSCFNNQRYTFATKFRPFKNLGNVSSTLELTICVQVDMQMYAKWIYSTAQKMKFSFKDFFSKCDQIRMKLRIQSHLLKKSLMENLIFYSVLIISATAFCKLPCLLLHAANSYFWENLNLFISIKVKVNSIQLVLFMFTSVLDLNKLWYSKVLLCDPNIC